MVTNSTEWYGLGQEPLFKYFESGWAHVRQYFEATEQMPDQIRFRRVTPGQPTVKELLERYDVEAGMNSCRHHIDKMLRGELL